MRNSDQNLYLDIRPWVAKAITQEEQQPEDRLWKKAPTIERVEQQRLQRIRFLRKHAKAAAQASVIAERLEQCNSQHRCISGACPVCGRLFQRWFVRASKPFIRKHLNNNTQELLALSLVPTSPKIKPGKLSDFSIIDLHRRLKYAMNKAGIGVAIGGIDLSFNEDQERKFKPFWNVHLYAITTGFKHDISEKLKRVIKYSNVIPRPKRVTRFENKARRRSYALKMHFERRIGYDQIKVTNGKKRKCRNTKGDKLLADQRVELFIYLDTIGFAERVFFKGAKPIQNCNDVRIKPAKGFRC